MWINRHRSDSPDLKAPSNARLAGFAISLLVPILFVTPCLAKAATVTITSVSSTNPLDDLNAGDQLTIGFTVLNDPREPAVGIEIHAFGFDANILRAQSFEVSQSIFNTSVTSTPIGWVASGGIQNLDHVAGGPISRATSPGHFNVPDRIRLITAVTLTPTRGSGEFDLGIEGKLISEGDVHARITFEVLSGGMTSVRVGGIAENGGALETLEGSEVFAVDTSVDSVDLFANGPAFVPAPVPVDPPLDPPADPGDEVAPPTNPTPPAVIRPPRPGSGNWHGELSSAAIPEPSTALLILGGLASLAAGHGGARRRAAKRNA